MVPLAMAAQQVGAEAIVRVMPYRVRMIGARLGVVALDDHGQPVQAVVMRRVVRQAAGTGPMRKRSP